MYKTDENGWVNVAGVAVCFSNEGTLLLNKDNECFEIPFKLLTENWEMYFEPKEVNDAKFRAIKEIV